MKRQKRAFTALNLDHSTSKIQRDGRIASFPSCGVRQNWELELEWKVILACALTCLWAAVPYGWMCTEFSGAVRQNRRNSWGGWCIDFLFEVHWQLVLRSSPQGFRGMSQVHCSAVWHILLRSRSSGRFFFCYFHTHCLLTGTFAQGEATCSVLYVAFLFSLLCILIFKHFLAVLMTTLNYHICVSYTKINLCL